MKRSINIVRGTIVGFLLLAVVIAPWLFGSVQPWARLLSLAVTLPAAAMICVIPAWRQLPTNGFLLLLFLSLGLLQLVAVPSSWQISLIPTATSLREFFGATSGLSRPVSVDPASTRIVLATLIGAVALYLASSRCIARWMLRWVLLVVAANGAGLAVMGVWQRQFSENLLYGLLQSNSTPFGPFVNRNNAAGFLLSSLAAAFGLLLLSLNDSLDDHWSIDQKRRLDWSSFRSGWVRVALILFISIVVGILFSQSRGGIFSTVIGFICTATLVMNRWNMAAAFSFTLVVFGCSLLLTLGMGEWFPISLRVTSLLDSTQIAADGRIDIWSSCVVLARDFWLTGSGLGTFERIFPVYDISPNGTIATHAENVFLQLACEGGLIVVAIALLIVVVFFKTAISLVQQKNSIAFTTGSMGVFLLTSQCLAACFDFGLYIPANLLQLSLLLGVFSGIACRVSHSDFSYAARTSNSSKSNRLSETRTASSFAQHLIDRRFEIVVICLICVGCFSVPDLIRASALETLPKGTIQESVWNSARESDSSIEQDLESEHMRLERNVTHRFDDSIAHYALAESFISRFERAINQDPSLKTNAPLRLSDFCDRLRDVEITRPGEREKVLLTSVVSDFLVPARDHLKISREACCLNPNVHLRLFHLSILDGESGKQDLERMVRLREGNRYQLFTQGQSHYAKGDYQNAFASWKPCLESKSAYRTQIVQSALKVASVDQLLVELFPRTDWFLLELANKHLLEPDQRELREKVIKLLAPNKG